MSITAVEPKRGTNVGRVVVSVLIENAFDVEQAARGQIQPDQVRRTTVEALVDTGATFLCLPQPVIDQLGLTFQRHKPTRTVSGSLLMSIHATAHVVVDGRDCNTEVMGLPEGRQPLLGQIPLEMMDWWIDPVSQKLIGNPEHGGQWMAEVF
ncbi:MAG: aspartyl protease family protein [Planctomycetes bacterium]|nr:aspartyl protease family protein [Planctomycetota bacterium]